MNAWMLGGVLVAAGVWAQSLNGGAALARKIPGLGDVHRKVTTPSEEAQFYFDQGLALYYGFNHEEAFRSFAKAAQLDPTCASCFYGAALSLGPNYNMPMAPEAAAAAFDAKQRAQKLSGKATDVERALIDAVSVRYPKNTPLLPQERANADRAYADKMKAVAARFPNDPDVQTLYAEALMDLNPWKLWNKDGTPAPNTAEIAATLEGVLRAHPDHLGANHLYVHATEASNHPEKALASAQRLEHLAPGAAYLVHMPAHVYQRMGKYEDASEANRRAIKVDQAYVKTGNTPAEYGVYAAHNQSFLAYSAMMEGRSKEAVAAADHAGALVTPAMAAAMPPIEFFAAQPAVTRAGLGLWDEVLNSKELPVSMPVSRGLYLHSKGLALLATGKTADARTALAELTKIRKALPKNAIADQNSAADILRIGEQVLNGKLLIASGKTEEGLNALRAAAQAEHSLSYAVPPDWWYPVRPVWGQELLKAGKPQNAERVFRADLLDHPAHPAALYGLSEALAAQGKKEEAAAAQEEFHKAWAKADLPKPPPG